MKRQKEELQAAYEKAKSAYELCKGETDTLRGRADSLKSRLEGAPEIDRSAEQSKKEELTGQKQAANAELDELSGRLHSNRAIFSALKEYIAELTEADRTRSWRKALSDTACGTVSGKEKIKLETYVQMTYFDRILARANTRFMMMSGGQYELKRKTEADSNRSQSGLELDVIDHYNGSERSVKTLSGGEAFKASLSLALGLSDEIQSSAGGIRLDAMFIDEGFGSLDEESLGQALRVLQELSGAGTPCGDHLPRSGAERKNRPPGACYKAKIPRPAGQKSEYNGRIRPGGKENDHDIRTNRKIERLPGRKMAGRPGLILLM